jgi:hypothetical protein
VLVFILLPGHPRKRLPSCAPANILVDSTFWIDAFDKFGTKYALIVSLYRLVRVKNRLSASARSHVQVPQPFARPPHGLSMISKRSGRRAQKTKLH